MATKQDSSGWSMQSILIGVVMAAAMSGGFYVFYYTPTNKKIESVRREVQKEEKALKTARTQAPLLKPMTRKVKLLEQQLVEYRAKIAKKGEVISLIKTIEGEAQRLGLRVVNMYTKKVNPSPRSGGKAGRKVSSAQQPAYAKVVLDTHMHADYHELEDFLATIQNLESFIVIERIDINTNEKAIAPEISLTLKISLYSENGTGKTYVVKK